MPLWMGAVFPQIIEPEIAAGGCYHLVCNQPRRGLRVGLQWPLRGRIRDWRGRQDIRANRLHSGSFLFGFL